MFDAAARKLIDPPLKAMGHRLADHGVSADAMTLIGLGFGLMAALLISIGLSFLALFAIALSRLADGLDGAIARAGKPSDFGGYLDIACDFLFYGAVPFAFVLLDPVQNAAAGAFLLTSFYFNGASFLGFAILAEKRGMHTDAQGQKSLYFSNGLLEGGETIAFFVLICLFPGAFPVLAWVFGGLCFVTAALRLVAAKRIFSD